jgi:hypothetical protein
MRLVVRSVLSVAVILAAAVALPAQGSSGGRVTITYTLTRIPKIASNQFAIWIEDERGAFVCTLFATDFMARRQGWRIRTQVCPAWIKAGDVAGTPQAAIDAVSGATPGNGTHSVVWDLKDRSGEPVAAGTYRYLIQGNIYWDNTVLWSGTVQVGGARNSSQAVVSCSPEGAEKEGTLISAVSAVYEPPK